MRRDLKFMMEADEREYYYDDDEVEHDLVDHDYAIYEHGMRYSDASCTQRTKGL